MPRPGSLSLTEAPLLGIVGGMGPLASNEFLSTVYKLHLADPEPGSPRCILYSDPAFPDRTATISEGRIELLATRLTRVVADLVTLGASRVVIACITAHCAVPSLPETLRQWIVSLLDLAIDEILACGRGPFLLLATSGTRAAQIFESHERWGLVADRVLFPSEQDQERLHAWIYQLKTGEGAEACLDWLAALRDRSGAEGLVFGCTELHLLHRALAGREAQALGFTIDPLWIVARDLPRLLSVCPAPAESGRRG